jgi:hypothetical protein
MSSQSQSRGEKRGPAEKKGKPRSAPKRSYQKAVSKNKKPTEVDSKKVYKIAIRELPSNNFNEDNFKECLNAFMEALHIPSDSIDFLHFMEGKLR